MRLLSRLTKLLRSHPILKEEKLLVMNVMTNEKLYKLIKLRQHYSRVILIEKNCTIIEEYKIKLNNLDIELNEYPQYYNFVQIRKEKENIINRLLQLTEPSTDLISLN